MGKTSSRAGHKGSAWEVGQQIELISWYVKVYMLKQVQLRQEVATGTSYKLAMVAKSMKKDSLREQSLEGLK